LTSPVFDSLLATRQPSLDADDQGDGYAGGVPGISVGNSGYAGGVGGGRGVAGTAVGSTVGGTAVGGSGVASAGVAGGAMVGAAVAVGVAVGSMSDGVTWITPGVRVGKRVGVGGVFLVQPAAMMSARPRTATIQSRAT
jgi:hypothetical protein